MYMYIYVYVYIYMFMYIYIYIYVYVYIYIYIYIVSQRRDLKEYSDHIYLTKISPYLRTAKLGSRVGIFHMCVTSIYKHYITLK